MKITNNTGISLPLAVWLATDDYDYNPDPKVISATSIMKPVRQILLKERLTKETRIKPDVSDLIASRTGSSLHDGVEKSWVNNYRNAMLSLGYPEKVVDKVKINPTEVKEGDIPVYLEQRGEREFRGYKISGKFDLSINGELNDMKSTSVYSYILGSKDKDYALQGSIYKWIHRDKITSDWINIQFIFTDWSKAQSRSSDNYPKQRLLEHRVELMSLQETENWLNQKIDILEAHAKRPEKDLPFCTDEELWRGETVYKYYSDPTKVGGRATKNFKDLQEANAHQAAKGKGVVITIPGAVKACGYCPVFQICTQKDQYDHG